MQRKMLGAILLPIPFAALPVIVVLAGALFGGKGGDRELVTTRNDAPAIEERVSDTNFPLDGDGALARTTAGNQSDGCIEDLSADF